MKQILVLYDTKPDHSEENARLIGGVFDELRAKAPDGLRYLVLRYGAGRFLHFAQQQDNAPSLPDFASFRLFQKGVSERWVARPEVNEPIIVGSYGMTPDGA
ncbi:MAG: hypothetical protein E7774_08765 [Bradyrhizobium sp.]|nr:MAG: hypothetical protein E7774_08765 [Bradyrhizobium sp.]